jgi:hypothetical protein
MSTQGEIQTQEDERTERLNLVARLMDVYIATQRIATDEDHGKLFDKLYDKPLSDLRILWRISNTSKRT